VAPGARLGPHRLSTANPLGRKDLLRVSIPWFRVF